MCVTKNEPLAFCWMGPGWRNPHKTSAFSRRLCISSTKLESTWFVFNEIKADNAVLFYRPICDIVTKPLRGNRHPQHPHALASDCPALNQIIRLVQHDFDYDLRFCYFFNFSLPVILASVESDWPR